MSLEGTLVLLATLKRVVVFFYLGLANDMLQ